MSEFQEITDFDIPELDVFGRLSEVQLLRYYEPQPGIFLAESPKVIHRALDAGYLPLSLLIETRHLKGEPAQSVMARCEGVPVYTAMLEELSPFLGFKLTSGMICAMRRSPLPTIEEVCQGARRIAVLEEIINPTNVGAIFRSAAALNMDAVILTSGCSDPLYRRAIRVGMGTVFQVPWTKLNKRVAWPREGMEILRELGFQTVAMALKDDSLSISDRRLREAEKLAVVLGTEGEGLVAETIADCDYTVRIPMSHGVDSLNVAAASAVAFWELGQEV
ncbi:MAG: RNA methyltransferase [Clostridiales bacterium]|nr:RNA methyltransferase [Clostridiales bacterium]